MADSVHHVTETMNETVTAVKEGVHETVDTVKEAVHQTVNGVKESLDVKRHVQKHPWAMMGTAVGLGYLGGCLIPLRPPRLDRADAVVSYPPMPALSEGQGRPSRPVPSRKRATMRQQTWLSELLAPEIERIKALAIGTTFALIRDIVLPAFPPALSPHVRDVIEGVGTKLGGEPIKETLLHEEFDRSSDSRREV